MELEQIKDQIPYYLTKEKAEGLIQELEKYSEKTAFYTGMHAEEHLQGDGWRGFQLFDFETEQKISVRGILLTNSCDFDPENPRNLPSRVTFAPLIRLSKLEHMFTQNGVDQGRMRNIIDSIRRQESTQFFFLPAQTTLEEDYVVWLSDVHSMPSDHFLKSSSEHQKLFTLNMTGFYLFILKLSIHFCRFHENVDRSATVVNV